MPRVFISYRRADSADRADEIHDALARRFGHKNVVLDVEDIPHGVDFTDFIGKSIRRMDAVVVVIGRTWATMVGESGQPRINDPNDLLHREIATALLIGIDVFPVLVDGAEMPDPNDLRQDLRRITRLNAIDVGIGARFKKDMATLIRAIEERSEANRLTVFASRLTSRVGRRWLIAAAVVASVVTAASVAVVLFRDQPDAGAAQTTVSEAPSVVGGAESATTSEPPTTAAPPASTAEPSTSTDAAPTVTTTSTTSTTSSTAPPTTPTTEPPDPTIDVVSLGLPPDIVCLRLLGCPCPRTITFEWEIRVTWPDDVDPRSVEVSYQVLGAGQSDLATFAVGEERVSNHHVSLTTKIISEEPSITVEVVVTEPVSAESRPRTATCTP